MRRRPPLAALALVAALAAVPAAAQEPAGDAADDAPVVALPAPDPPDHNARSRDRRGDRDEVDPAAVVAADEDDDEEDDDEEDDADDRDDAPVVAPARPPASAPQPTPVVTAPPAAPVTAPVATAAASGSPPPAPPAQVAPPPAAATPAPSRPGVSEAPRLALLTPGRLLPRARARLPGRRPVLRWRPQQGATVYNLQVFRLRGARVTKVLSAFPRRARHRVGPGRLRPGAVYVWRVWAFDGIAGRFMPRPVGVSTFRTRPRNRSPLAPGSTDAAEIED